MVIGYEMGWIGGGVWSCCCCCCIIFVWCCCWVWVIVVLFIFGGCFDGVRECEYDVIVVVEIVIG